MKHLLQSKSIKSLHYILLNQLQKTSLQSVDVNELDKTIRIIFFTLSEFAPKYNNHKQKILK